MPARLRKLKRAAEKYGIELVEPRGGGSHWQFRRKGNSTYPVPASNGLKTEIPDKYIASFCRCFSLDEKEFRALL